MKLSEDQQRLKGLLQETITLLCKNGLNYDSEFSVEALIVITLDQDKIFHTNIKETVAKDGIDISVSTEGTEEQSPKSTGTRTPKTAKKRKVHRDESPEVPAKKSTSHSEGTEIPESHNIRDEEEPDDDDQSDIVVIKNEEGNEVVQFNQDLRNASQISGSVLPMADLQYVHTAPVVDQDGQLIQQHGSGWVEGEQGSGAANVSTADVSEGDATTNATASAPSTGMKLPVARPNVATAEITTRQTRQTRSTLQLQGEEISTTQIDTRGRVRETSDGKGSASDDRTVVTTRRQTRSSQPIGKDVAAEKSVARGKVKSGRTEGNEVVQSTVEEREAEENNEETEMDQGQVTVDTEQNQADVPQEQVKSSESSGIATTASLKKIISSAVDKVRKEVAVTTSTPTITRIAVGHTVGTSALRGKQQPTQQPAMQNIAVAPTTPSAPKMQSVSDMTLAEDWFDDMPRGRGRPLNLPVTTTPKGTAVAVHKPIVTVTDPESEVLRVSAQPIKVFGLSNNSASKKKTKPHICNSCGQMFTSYQSLSDHECGEKNLFQCGICNAMFMRKENLKKHFEEHREEVEVTVLESQ